MGRLKDPTTGAIAVIVALFALSAVIGAVWFAQSQGQKVGAIEFGGGYDSELVITNPHSTFASGQTVAYTAALPGGAQSMMLTEWLVQEQSGGVEQTLATRPMPISNPSDDLIAGKLTKPTLDSFGVKAGGSYALRIFRGDTKLAEGTFSLSR